MKGNGQYVLHDGSENDENQKKYRLVEKSVKKCHDLEPKGTNRNSGYKIFQISKSRHNPYKVI